MRGFGYAGGRLGGLGRRGRGSVVSGWVEGLGIRSRWVLLVLLLLLLLLRWLLRWWRGGDGEVDSGVGR